MYYNCIYYISFNVILCLKNGTGDTWKTQAKDGESEYKVVYVHAVKER